MVTKVNEPLLDLMSEPITGINMNGAGSGINMNGAAITNLPAPTDPNDGARLADVQVTAFPVGVGPLPWPGTEGSVPTGWLLCDGTIYNIIDYPALHAVLQNVYGGDNITTFGVPDMRSRVPLGKDNMGGAAAGIVPSAISEGLTGGVPEHTLTIAEMPAHNHNAVTGLGGGHTHPASTADLAGDHVHSNGVLVYNGNQGGGGSNAARDQGNTGIAGDHTHTLTITPVADHVHTVTVDPEGGGNPHTNLQPYLVLNYIIKAL